MKFFAILWLLALVAACCLLVGSAPVESKQEVGGSDEVEHKSHPVAERNARDDEPEDEDQDEELEGSNGGEHDELVKQDDEANEDGDNHDDDQEEEMIEIEPSEFATADDDRTHDDQFEYGNEDDLLVKRDD